MVVDPWGTVIAQAPDVTGIITADLDLDRLAAIRDELPSLANRRPFALPYEAAPGNRRTSESPIRR
jgi:predicted amidohydrolase